MHRRAAAIGFAAAILLVAGCSSDNDSDHTDHSSESAATSTTSAPTSAASVAAPTSSQLQQTLALVVDPAVDSATKAAAMENGQARLANLDAMTAALANYGQIDFVVTEPTVEGETATAGVAISTPRGAAPATPNTWVLIDGIWKISDASACQLLAMGQAPCV